MHLNLKQWLLLFREGNDQSAALQRRKYLSFKPNLVPRRPRPLDRPATSLVKEGSDVAVAASESDKPTASSQPAPMAASLRLRSPSEDVKLVPSESTAPSAENSPKPADGGKQCESTSGSRVEEAPSRVSVVAEKEASELPERAETLVSSTSQLPLSPSRLLNHLSHLQTRAKAQKCQGLPRGGKVSAGNALC